jgi:broad specificity phosphatase PhoE
MDFIQASDFFASLASDERVYLLVRHGERRHITPADPDFGAHVGLTDKGREQALSLGRCIPPEGDICFYSSPVGRCMETAQFIGKGRADVADVRVEPLDCLAEYFVQNYDAYLNVLRAGFYEGICAWLHDEETRASNGSDTYGSDKPFAPLATRSEEMLAMMLEKGSCRFNIFATHDAWVVPCLTHFCKMHFSPQRWMNYLTGMAVVTGTDGKNVKRIVPVTGLETGWLNF